MLSLRLPNFYAAPNFRIKALHVFGNPSKSVGLDLQIHGHTRDRTAVTIRLFCWRLQFRKGWEVRSDLSGSAGTCRDMLLHIASLRISLHRIGFRAQVRRCAVFAALSSEASQLRRSCSLRPAIFAGE